jgi:hypothetical protein
MHLQGGNADGGSVWPYDPPLDSICPECNLVGAAGALKGIFGLVEGMAAKAPSLVEALANAVPVGSALKADFAADVAHYAAVFTRRGVLQSGRFSTLVGDDGVSRIHVVLRTTEGYFNYIYQQTKIGWELTHQMWNKTPK